MKNILILGGCGFIGSFLVKRLQTEHNVILYDLCKPEYPFEGKYIIGNFAEEQNFYSILRENEINMVFHLISTTVPTEDTTGIEAEIVTNVIPTVRLLDAMIKAEVKKMIFASSGGTVYGESKGGAHKPEEHLTPVCSYGIQKCSIENYISLYNRYYGTEFMVARISNPYGVWKQQNRVQGIVPIFIQRLLKAEPITVYGNTKRDYIFIKDLIDALECLMKYSGPVRLFNIGTGKSSSIQQLIDCMEQSTGKKFPYIDYQEIRKCDVQENVLDITETINCLGWEPKFRDIREGIAYVIEQMSK